MIFHWRSTARFTLALTYYAASAADAQRLC